MPGLADLLGNGPLEQIFIYGIAQQLLGGALAPFIQAITNDQNTRFPETPISPADAALAVVRNVLSLADATAQAAKSGVPAGDFEVLVANTGDAPAPTDLAVALRRQFIDAATYDQGIRQGRLRDEWGPLIQKLATDDPTPTLALTALLKGQTDEGTATSLYERWGGNPTYFDLAFNTEGAGPSPLEAATAVHRGIIPQSGTGAGVVSFEQAVRESQYRNKWESVFWTLSQYLPPPRTISALVKEGAMTEAQGAKYLADHGMPADLITIYLNSATTTKTSTTRELSQSTIQKLYTDQLVDRATAEKLLTDSKYTTAEAAYILEVWDMVVEEHALSVAVNRVHSLYTAHKIDDAQASTALGELQVPTENVAKLMTVWGHERAANVRTLTPAQIAAAWDDDIIPTPAAIAELVGLGYTSGDALILLEIKHKGKLTAAELSGSA